MHLTSCKYCSLRRHSSEEYNQEYNIINNQSQCDAVEENMSHLSEEFDMILDTGSVSADDRATHNSRKRGSAAMQDNKIITTSGVITKNSYLSESRSRVIGKRRVDASPHGYGAYVHDADETETSSEINPAKRSRMVI